MSVHLRERPHDMEERSEAVCITSVPRIRLVPYHASMDDGILTAHLLHSLAHKLGTETCTPHAASIHERLFLYMVVS